MLRVTLKALSIVVMVVTTFYSYSQDLDLKKDVILKDKVPYAKFSGKMGLLKPADVMVSSLTGDSLIAIKAWSYPSKNPVFDFLNGYEIRFVASGKRVIKPCTVSLASKEQLLNFIINGRDYTSRKWEDTFKQMLIVDNSVDPVAEAAFIEKYINTPAIEWAKEYEAKEKEILSGIFPIGKKAGAALDFQYGGSRTTATGGSAEIINVYQGNLIATIVKENKTAGILKYVYTFKWTLNQKVTVGGKEVDSVVIATATIDSFPKIFINADGKGRSIEISNPAAAERELTQFLINNQKL